MSRHNEQVPIRGVFSNSLYVFFSVLKRTCSSPFGGSLGGASLGGDCGRPSFLCAREAGTPLREAPPPLEHFPNQRVDARPLARVMFPKGFPAFPTRTTVRKAGPRLLRRGDASWVQVQVRRAPGCGGGSGAGWENEALPSAPGSSVGHGAHVPKSLTLSLQGCSGPESPGFQAQVTPREGAGA